MTCTLVLAAVILGGLADGWRWGLAVWIVADAITYVVADVTWRIRDGLI
jgi:hypothetical protein